MLRNYFSNLYENTAKNSGIAAESMLEQYKNAVLLDCGCWDGINTKKFGSIIGTKFLHGIELNKNKALEAQKNGIKVKISDLNKKLPYNDNLFDVIIAYHVIEHLVNVRLFVSELHRILKKNGYVIIGTPNLASWHNVFALFMGIQPFSGPTIKPDYKSDCGIVKQLNKARMKKIFSEESETLDHVKVMTTKALIGLLKDFNFKIKSSEGFGYYPFPHFISVFLSKIDIYHSHYIVVKAIK
ncbi:MAG TPA: methyltransferase domain-containing protein [Candidatus Nanoarchaeia archaeon]|nr:methyltransferase domain-containing protein [Candidatus Nanoarchaeia archaeon]